MTEHDTEQRNVRPPPENEYNLDDSDELPSAGAAVAAYVVIFAIITTVSAVLLLIF